MTYRLLVKIRGLWQEVGFDHTTREEASDEARTNWWGYAFIVLPQ
jgi:uncharacterized lipoprotein